MKNSMDISEIAFEELDECAIIEILNKGMLGPCLADRTAKVVVPVVISILLLLGLVGNFLVIFVTFKTERVIKHPVHSMLVMNLAVADLVYLLSSAPYQIITHSVSGWGYGAFLCAAFPYFTTQTMAVGVFTMCALALMRFAALMMPYRVQRSFVATAGRKAGWLVIFVVWMLGSILSIPNATNHRLVALNAFENKDYVENEEDYADAEWKVFAALNNEKPTNISYSSRNMTVNDEDDEVFSCEFLNLTTSRAYDIALLVITYIIPFLLVSILYFFIGREVLCYMNRKQPKVDSNNCGKGQSKEYIKATTMVLCLIIAFLFCWFPHHLYVMVKITPKFEVVPYAVMRIWMDVVGKCFSYAHACVNPIIYTFAAPGFRRNIRKCFKGENCQRDIMSPKLCSLRNRRKKTTAKYTVSKLEKSYTDDLRAFAGYNRESNALSRTAWHDINLETVASNAPITSSSPLPWSHITAV
ncbi:unnamed protein product [Clavelina lepadiformis]|uniref:G-protein coupled receptors family 1 profile domain-containing protein n=1 Tax=Clavelina lepadiformis TaxID=159417 RepID=A0ABP0GX91_CLALP